ncbi:MAG: protein phosphatase 2C domain-containing protein [Ruminococcus sp.]|nr:protein phosphatase 2C domain-containing protein [Ruminococcus sp.]
MLIYSSFSDKGDRDINEDSIAVAEKDGRYCFVLCDGLGGHGKGDLASASVTGSIIECFNEIGTEDKFLDTAMVKAQEKLLAEQKRIGAVNQMKTTAVVLLIHEDKFRYAYIGDSRLYHFRKNKVFSRTLDHSVPQMLVYAGDIKEKHIRCHPDRNRLLRVMGVEWDSPRYVITEVDTLRGGDAFLLCSDGFWEPIVEKEMCRLLKKSDGAEDWLTAMSRTVKENGKGTNMDNYSAITVMYRD